jgi:hypothetical protein
MMLPLDDGQRCTCLLPLVRGRGLTGDNKATSVRARALIPLEKKGEGIGKDKHGMSNLGRDGLGT